VGETDCDRRSGLRKLTKRDNALSYRLRAYFEWDTEIGIVAANGLTIIEMARLAPSPDRRPARQSDMQRLIAEWFVSRTGEHPSDSQIAEHVKDFYDRDWSAN
jgi:hypothetical protein